MRILIIKAELLVPVGEIAANSINAVTIFHEVFAQLNFEFALVGLGRDLGHAEVDLFVEGIARSRGGRID